MSACQDVNQDRIRVRPMPKLYLETETEMLVLRP